MTKTKPKTKFIEPESHEKGLGRELSFRKFMNEAQGLVKNRDQISSTTLPALPFTG
jgi:hypothetical protein